MGSHHAKPRHRRRHASRATAETTRQVHEETEGALRSAGSPRGGRLADHLRVAAEAGGRVAWRLAKRHPFLAVVLLSAGGSAAATEIGLAELAVGGAIALAAYGVLRQGEPPVEAMGKVEQETGA